MEQANYDDIANDYKRLEDEQPVKEGLINYWMLEFCGNVKNKRVLDLGCGSGFFTRAVAEKGAKEVIGVDISKEEIKMAEQEEEREPLNIKYFQGDLENFDYSKIGPVGLITASVSLHYAKNTEELRKFISLPTKNLETGGIFVACVNNPANNVGDWPTEKKELDEVQDSDGKRIKVGLYDLKGEKVVEFINYSYEEEVYKKILEEEGYGEFELFEMVPPEETIKKYPEMDWTKNIEKPTLVIIKAIKK
jgi:toxoflavin synthase